jgi:hypothetical protein
VRTAHTSGYSHEAAYSQVNISLLRRVHLVTEAHDSKAKLDIRIRTKHATQALSGLGWQNKQQRKASSTSTGIFGADEDLRGR